MAKITEYEGRNWKLFNADCIEGMAQMPESSVDAAVFSSPFSNLYIYSESERDLGNATDHEEFLKHFQFFTDALFRVMKPGTVICDHLKDLAVYQGSSETGESGILPFSDWAISAYRKSGFVMRSRVTIRTDPVLEQAKTKPERLLYKNVGENSRVSAPGMPEYVIVMRKSSRGIKEGEPVKHAIAKWGDERFKKDGERLSKKAAERLLKNGMVDAISQDLLDFLVEEIGFPLDQWRAWAEPVWMNSNNTGVLNSRFKGSSRDEKHICPMPLDLINRCLTLYSAPGDIVLDPFSGIGSTGYKAVQMARKFIGFELKPEYAAKAAKYIAEAEVAQMDLFGAGL